MSRQTNTEIMPIELSNRINRWDYDNSVLKMRGLAKQWSKMTAQVARELYLAKEYLINQKGQRRDPDAPDYILYTWNDYCKEIGLDRQVADYWIKKFTPRELSDNGKDILLLTAPVKTETTNSDRALMEARIEKVLRTGKRPSDWTDKEESELKRRMANARYEKLVEELNMPVVARAKHDYFAEILKRSKDIANFQLTDRHQLYAQAAIFEHIDVYLKTFTDPEVKAQAAFNLALKTRNLSNEIAEMNIQLSEALPSKNEEHNGE